MNTEQRLQEAVQSYWDARRKNREKQVEGGKIDAGTRGEVTGGTQMGALEVLVADILCDAGLKPADVRTRTSLELPGYYRPEKKWDLVVVSEGKLVTAMEFKSQVGPSFGNNFNNRSEEVIGSATDVWVAFREQRFGNAPVPFLGYFLLLEDCDHVRKAIGYKEPFFSIDPIFKEKPEVAPFELSADTAPKRRKAKAPKVKKVPGVSYSKRYEILCRRLVLERVYSASCLVMATKSKSTTIVQPAEDLTFKRFEAALRGNVLTFLQSR